MSYSPAFFLLLLTLPLAAADRPNIIFFLADDMGMGDTSAYQDWSGNPDNAQLHTPAVEKLANMGVRFTDAHSPSSRCSSYRGFARACRSCTRTRTTSALIASSMLLPPRRGWALP